MKHLGLKKWIVRLLETHSGTGPVAAVQHKVVWQTENLRLNILQQLFMVASGQIGSAYAPPKHRVAHDGLLARLVYEDHMSGRMPRHKAHLQLRFTHSDGIAMG